MLNQKRIVLIATVCGALAVSVGAFGAHALKDILVSNGRQDTFELAVRYHFYHTFALLTCSWCIEKFSPTTSKLAAWMFLIGILFFSGSLYVLSIFNYTKIAMVTPIGGMFLIFGWIALFYSAFKKSN
jgi:uncharacterized membrane protein YgdD (TMEM256/DUF423 family)